MGGNTSQISGSSFAGAPWSLFAEDNPLLYSGPYANESFRHEAKMGKFTTFNYYEKSVDSVGWRCAEMLKAKDHCMRNDYTYDSTANRCQDELEDYHQCVFRGKEFRFVQIMSNWLRKEENERTYVKWMNNYDQEAYKRDGGDHLARAEHNMKVYAEKGLKGPKYVGNYD